MKAVDGFIEKYFEGARRDPASDAPTTSSTLMHLISRMTDATDSDDLDITRNVRRSLGVDAKAPVNRE